MRKLSDFFGKGKRIYLAGIIRLALGIIFLLAASTCRWSKVVAVIGILTLLGGILIFVLGPKRINAMIAWFNQKSPVVLRLMSILVIAIGILIISSA